MNFWDFLPGYIEDHFGLRFRHGFQDLKPEKNIIDGIYFDIKAFKA
jgi:hypothetical protein